MRTNSLSEEDEAEIDAEKYPKLALIKTLEKHLLKINKVDDILTKELKVD